MKINNQILSIPPYISTSWKNIASLHVESQDSTIYLVVTLLSGARIEIPQLEPIMIEAIFSAHARYLEQEEKAPAPKLLPGTPLSLPDSSQQLASFALPLKDMQGLGNVSQHNPEQADTPDLPKQVLEKVGEITKAMGIDDLNALPKPEPHCNCVHCQIARAMRGDVENAPAEEPEEIVSDEELKFRTWDIAQTTDKLYVVTNPLDDKEHYNVFLGDPVGCTCGHHHCDHVRAVLNS